MSAYNIEHFLADFSNRTIENLEFIEENNDCSNVYEVTQLINSLLGLIIIPVEAAKEKTNGIKSNDFELKKVSNDSYQQV